MAHMKAFVWMHLAFIHMFIYTCDAVQCFNCNDVPLPQECSRVVQCNDGEKCYLEQVITPSGGIKYSSGCLSKLRCNAGHSSIRDLLRRDNKDITTCINCCDGDFCNNQGCGHSATPRDQRGPYCYTCDVSSPDQPCRDLTVCGSTQVCGLYEPHKFYGLYTHLVYESSCMSKLVCDAIHRSNLNSETRCIPTCCNADFCNTECNGTSTV